MAYKATRESTEVFRNLAGKSFLRKVVLSDVNLGQSNWDELPAYILDRPSPIEHLDGILGPASLGIRQLKLDFQNSRLSWEKRGPLSRCRTS